MTQAGEGNTIGKGKESSSALSTSLALLGTSLGRLDPALMHPERLVEPDSWAGHIPFAFWITAAARPRRYVELGVHTGNSYCAVSQTVAELGLATECFGIDHWFGDEQAGLYGEDVYSELKAWHDPRYAHFSRLLRMSFLEGRDHLVDGSVDLLHIDGLHTYEAVREDFETWQPKMSERCVVLFHDTNVHQPDFGVCQFWREIERRYPTFEFLHSNGLGVAYTGTAPLRDALPGLAGLFELSAVETGGAAVRTFFSRLGDSFIERIRSRQVSRRGELVSRELHTAYQNLAALDTDRSRIIAEQEGLRERALKWDKLAVRTGGSISLDLNEVSQGLHQLYNSDNPQARRDREILKRQFAELSRSGTLEPSYKDLILRQAERIGRKVKSRVLRRPEAVDDPAIAAIRSSGLLSERHYAFTDQARAAGRDPLEHYLSDGEKLGVAPSDKFDPGYYGRRQLDVAESGFGLLRHYVLFGQHEGRSGLAPAERLSLPVLADDGRARVLLLLHSAERSDAVVLALNMARLLRDTHDVIAFFKQGGPLRAAFAGSCVATIDMPEEPDMQRVDLIAVLHRLAREVSPAFAVAASAETREYVRALATANIGVVQLVQDFASAISPPGSVYDFLPFAHRVAFPSHTVADSYRREHAFLSQRRFDILRPSTTVSPDAPLKAFGADVYSEAVRRKIRPIPNKDEFIVVGIGDVSLRSGTDIFAHLAAEVESHSASGRPFRFIWVGRDPTGAESEFSRLLADQIERSGLTGRFELIGELEDYDELFQQADALALTSRQDPLPTTGINALAAGVPVLCFEGASSLAEQLTDAGADGASLVVPFFNVHAMAARLTRLADDTKAYDAAVLAGREIAVRQADPKRFVAEILRLGEEAASEAEAVRRDYAILAKQSAAFSQAVYGGTQPHDDYPQDPLQNYLLRSRVARGQGKLPATGLRRPLPGFNPIIYAEDCLANNLTTEPLVHWVQEGRPQGRWTHPLVTLTASNMLAPSRANALLHGHFYYVDLLEEFLTRLNRNQASIDLILTVPDERRAQSAWEAIAKHPPKGSVDVIVVPNNGRDIGPFLSGLGSEKLAPYEIIGHVHGKRSPHVEASTGEQWRTFLWEHTIGGLTPAADICIAAMEADPKLGLIFPEDANLHGWDANLPMAEPLARRMGRTAPLPIAFEWPIGTMFWTRRKALDPLFNLGLDWSDYPKEPLPLDGTLLHALERLMPFAVEEAGFGYATTHLEEVQR
ncbi:rhamnan synthesis F family protein [Devosia naphthalenivorans]|uniref:rhamnan synthesis F family protein n=1 Tax=Devosia naphthalenivorans TaxID=2082392 RepID=UPI000D35A59C|nr:rhamnan synthesis F family protein [Devosia naphthalenivorans]